jgi:hypothetical protein
VWRSPRPIWQADKSASTQRSATWQCRIPLIVHSGLRLAPEVCRGYRCHVLRAPRAQSTLCRSWRGHCRNLRKGGDQVTATRCGRRFLQAVLLTGTEPFLAWPQVQRLGGTRIRLGVIVWIRQDQNHESAVEKVHKFGFPTCRVGAERRPGQRAPECPGSLARRSNHHSDLEPWPGQVGS